MNATNQQVVAILALAGMLLLAGCTEALDDDTDDAIEEEMDADELQAEALAAMEAVETASFELNQTTSVWEMEQTIIATGVIDAEADEMRMEMDMGELLFDATVEAYVLGETMYMNFWGQWIQAEMDDAALWEHDEDQLDQQETFLEEGDLDINETTTFDGHEVYVVDIELDQEEMDEIFAESDEFDDAFEFDDDFVGDDAEFDDDVFDTEETVTNASITQYIDAENYWVRHTVIEYEVDGPFGSHSVEMSMTLSDFNEPVDIELPPEAEDAMDFDELLEFDDEWEDDLFDDDDLFEDDTFDDDVWGGDDEAAD